jgi:hypothetical protein
MNARPESGPLQRAALCGLVLLTTAAGALASDDPALVIEGARIVDGGLHVVIANRGDTPIPHVELGAATRAGGRLVGSARHRLEPLAPGAAREERLPLHIWGSDRPDLRPIIERGCCTTRVWLEPGGHALEIDHALAPNGAASPPRE